MKSGIKTSEFWITLITAIGGPTAILTIASEYLDPNGLAAVIVTAIGAAAAVIWKYVSGRAEVKAASNGT